MTRAHILTPFIQKYKLYGYWRSSCSWRLRAALLYKGIDFEYVPVNLLKGEHLEESYLKISPTGQVPTLQIGENLYLNDSIAILEFLEENHPEPSLLPKDPIQRAKVRAIVNSITSGIQPVQNLKVLKFVEEQYQGNKVQWAQTWIEKGFRATENLIAQSCGKYCVGDELTHADLALVPQVYNAKRFGVDIGSRFPNIFRVHNDLEKLDVFKKSDPSQQVDAVNN